MVDSFRALIDLFGIGAFAEVAGVSYGAAKQMRRRDSVGPEYWPQIIMASHSRGWLSIDANLLMDLAADRAERAIAAVGGDAEEALAS